MGRPMGMAVARSVRGLLALVVAIGVVAVLGAAGLAWRLSQGPLDVSWVARRIEAAANGPERPTRLGIGDAVVRWAGFAEGAGQGLELQLRGVRLTREDGAVVAAVGAMDLSVSMGRLLVGQVVPRAIAVTGMKLELIRNAAGEVSLDLGGLDLGDTDSGAAGPSVRETLAELARPVRREGVRPARPDLQHLEQLVSVHVGDSELHLHDAGLRRAVRLEIGALDLRRQAGGGVRGTATATLGLGVTQAKLAMRAELAPGGGTEMRLAFSPVSAGAVQDAAPEIPAELAPVLDPAQVLDAQVQGAATLTLDPALHPTKATLQLEAGTGRVRIAGAVIGFDSVEIAGEAGWSVPGWVRPQTVSLPRVRVVLHAPGGGWPSTATLSAQASIGADGVAGTVRAGVDHVAFADIGALWPARLGGHVRPWLVPSVTAGTARDAQGVIGFRAPLDLSSAAVTSIDASVRGEDVTIWWLRPMPPIEGAQALLTINNLETMDIAVSSARQGAVPLKNGVVHITGLNVKDQFLQLDADVSGQVAEMVAFLKDPRLHLLDKKPITMRNPGGTFAGHLTVNLPLNDDLRFDQVRIQTSAHGKDVRLGGLVAGRDLERGDVQVDASSDMLKATGTAAVAGIPSDLTVEMDFRDGGGNQVVQRAQAVARATAKQLMAAGLDSGSLMPSGAGLFTGRYIQRRDGSAEVQVDANLRDPVLAMAGWKKEAGQPAEASSRLLLRGDRMLGVESFRAKGPGMAVEGHAEMVGDKPLLLVIDRAMLGRTQASGRLLFPAVPGQPVRATLSGAVLDISEQRAAPPPQAGAPPPAADMPWVADARFDRVLLSGDRGLTGVVAHAENDGRRLVAASVTSGGPERLEATVRREGAGRRLTLRAADGGALMRAADVLDVVQGGALSVDAVYDDSAANSPLAGTTTMTNFRVRNAPALGKLLQAVTIYGMVDALSGPGLSFTNMVMPFRWDGTVLEVSDVRAFSASLGLTAKGRIDTGRKTIDVQGTVVPAYVFNSLLGRIPLLGRLFSAEQGGGLVAVDYGLRGPVGDPAVRVNPLSALTPGFLRGLFHVFD